MTSGQKRNYTNAMGGAGALRLRTYFDLEENGIREINENHDDLLMFSNPPETTVPVREPGPPMDFAYEDTVPHEEAFEYQDTLNQDDEEAMMQTPQRIGTVSEAFRSSLMEVKKKNYNISSILIVDDEPIGMMGLELNLQKLMGFTS